MFKLIFFYFVEMDDDFVEMVKLLVFYILFRDMMMIKCINGMEGDRKRYVKVC